MIERDRLLALVINPIVVKDAALRMRSWRAPLGLTLYLGLLGASGFAVFGLATLFASGQQAGTARIGTVVFAALAFFQLSLVALFAPALAAGAISGERERRTMDVLLVSQVSALGIVWGKLVASVAFLLLLILGALPLFAAVFLFGGIDLGQFVVTQLLTVGTAVTLAAVSIALSAAFRRTLVSTVAAYGAAFAGLVGTLAGGFLLTLVIWQRSGNFSSLEIHPLLLVNPVFALLAVLELPNGAAVHLGALSGLLVTVPSAGGGPGPEVQPWQATIAAQMALIAGSLWVAVRLVGGRRRRPRPQLPAPPVEPPDPLQPALPLKGRESSAGWVRPAAVPAAGPAPGQPVPS